MAIGYAKKEDLLEHVGHELEVVAYGTLNNSDPASVAIECLDCFTVLIDEEPEEDDGLS